VAKYRFKIHDFQGLIVSQGMARTLHRRGGKLIHLSMAYLLSNNCTKSYCNQTTSVKVTVEAWLVYFLQTQCITLLGKLHAGSRNRWSAYGFQAVTIPVLRWRRGVVVSGVRRMNEVNARRARLVPGWVTVFGRVYHLGM